MCRGVSRDGLYIVHMYMYYMYIVYALHVHACTYIVLTCTRTCHVHVYTYVRTCKLYMYMHNTCTCTCMWYVHVPMYICMHVYTCTCTVYNVYVHCIVYTFYMNLPSLTIPTCLQMEAAVVRHHLLHVLHLHLRSDRDPVGGRAEPPLRVL